MDKVQKPNNHVQHTPSSKSFQTYQYCKGLEGEDYAANQTKQINTMRKYMYILIVDTAMEMKFNIKKCSQDFNNLSGPKVRPARKADNFTAICEPNVWKLWGPRRLTILWASTACYRDSFTVVKEAIAIH
jgi:hypothetical protein